MSLRGLGYLEKEGIIQNIDVLDDSKIRIVVKASMEGYGFSNDHAMLNIEDEEYVSLSRYHSIISTFQDLSKHLGEEITEDNKESLYDTTIIFSRYARDIFSSLQVVAKDRGSSWIPYSRTIYSPKNRADFDWIYISSLELDDSEEKINDMLNKVLNYVEVNVGSKYGIGNYRSKAMEYTRLTKQEDDAIIRATEINKRGFWKIHSPRKLCYHNRRNNYETEYTFAYNYVIIADGALSDFNKIQHFDLPRSVKHIGCGSFARCTDLIDINLPDGLIDIGWRCFAGCSSLQTVIIPNTVKEIESLAFAYCSSLHTIVMPDELEYIGRNVFEGCPTELRIIINKEYEKSLMTVLHEYKNKIEVVDDFVIIMKRSWVR